MIFRIAPDCGAQKAGWAQFDRQPPSLFFQVVHGFDACRPGLHLGGASWLPFLRVLYGRLEITVGCKKDAQRLQDIMTGLT